MDKKLTAAVIFGLLAVTVANLLLSAGIVSLILSERQDTSTEPAGVSSTFPGMLVTTMNSVSIEGANNTTTAPNVTKAAMPAANVTVTPVPTQPAGQMPAGLPAGGQFTPPSGQMPSGGDLSQFTGQAPPSGQAPPAGSGQAPGGTGPAPSGSQQQPSGTGQLPAGTGQPASGSGSAPDNTTQSLEDMGYVPVDVSGLLGNRTKATPTPRPASAFANFSSLWNQ